MVDVEHLRAVERACGFSYPPELWAAMGELSATAHLPRFAEVFPRIRAATAGDVATARTLGIPDSLVPFACHEQLAHTDYYCCLPAGCKASRAAVFVFAIHAVVADWPNFAAFVDWIRRVCNDKQTTLQPRNGNRM